MSAIAARRIVARAPTRIDLGGGWTDVPPYCDREGGFVCNVAIARYATATLSTTPDDGAATRASEAMLVRAAQRRAGVPGVHATVRSDFPVAAGLGGSSAASAALLGAHAAWRGEPWDRAAIAEAGRRIEVEDLGVAGGRQDHYAATHGGALALTFTDRVAVRRIALAPRTRDELVSRSVLVYTGESRVSGDTITAVLDAYEAREARVVHALRRMRELAEAMAAALERGDLDAVGELLAEHWVHQRALHPSIPTPRIDEIVRCARAEGGAGAKAMGASGGGCVLVLANAGEAGRVRRAVAGLGDILEFDVDERGLMIVSPEAR